LHLPEPGQLVDVRQRRYVVVEVTASTLPPAVLSPGTLDRPHLVTLSSVEDDALGEDLQVIWGVEPGAEATNEVLDVAAPLFREPNAQERDLLSAMHSWAEQARYRPDSKAQELISWLHATLKPDTHWTQERAIIFTEYRATQNWLYGLLAREGFAEKGPDGEPRLLMLYGGMDAQERETIKAAFQADPADAAVRILLATDAASEGIDLQNHCSRLIHYEIPWNPNRLEQRNGRIDRHGQRAPEVTIYHFVSSTYRTITAQDQPVSKLDADLEFLRQAVDKIEKIREDLGSVGPVIADQVEEAMLGRRRTLDTQRAEANVPSRHLQAFERKQREKLAERITQLYEQLLEGKRELNMTPANIQAVVETALELAQQPPLQRYKLHDPHGKLPPIEVFDVPNLSGSWALCTARLLHPHTRVQRPIVFDHALVQGRDDVVLAHLNHRLVTMSLRLLRAEVWSSGVYRHLYCVTARTVPTLTLDTPAVIAHARLLVLGGDNQRLYEELIAAGGYLRAGRFVRMNEGQLKTALAAVQDAPVSPTMQQSLCTQWEKHREALQQALESRMRERSTSLQRTLADRANKEQHDIRAILTELQTSILQELRQAQSPTQLTLAGFSTDERQQFEYNMSALQERTRQIDTEIVEETARIQRRFANPQPRLFPVTVTYLVPETLAR